MLLQGKCFADIGQPQRCWSAWRRAILYAELRVSTHSCQPLDISSGRA
jgi:hypothetical protein